MAKAKTIRKAKYYSKAEQRVLASGKGAMKLLKLLSKAPEHEEISVIATEPAVSILLRKYKI